MEEQVNKLVEWLRETVHNAGLKGAVVGVSGGIDSAVVANLIKKAFPEQSMGVMLPCKSHPDDLKYAKMVIDQCGINHMTVDLTAAHDSLFSTVVQQIENRKELDQDQQKLADANLRARLRMSTLYTVATNYKYLVVGTDNAAEWYTGYFTKYGDGGVDLVPLVHYTKSEVRELAKVLEVPNDIIEKPPSAGLWEGQTDEAEMGVTYDTIDAFLNGETISDHDRSIIERMHKATEHKRSLAVTPPNFKNI